MRDWRLFTVPAATKLTVLSEEEIERLYPNEWVLFEITQLTRVGRVRGRVLCHSNNRSKLSEHRIRFHESHPGARTGVIFAGSLVDPDFGGMIVL